MVKKTLFALSVAAVLALTPNVASAQRFHGEDGMVAVGMAVAGVAAAGVGAVPLWGLDLAWGSPAQRLGVPAGDGGPAGVLPATLRGTAARDGVESGLVGDGGLSP